MNEKKMDEESFKVFLNGHAQCRDKKHVLEDFAKQKPIIESFGFDVQYAGIKIGGCSHTQFIPALEIFYGKRIAVYTENGIRPYLDDKKATSTEDIPMTEEVLAKLKKDSSTYDRVRGIRIRELREKRPNLINTIITAQINLETVRRELGLMYVYECWGTNNSTKVYKAIESKEEEVYRAKETAKRLDYEFQTLEKELNELEN